MISPLRFRSATIVASLACAVTLAGGSAFAAGTTTTTSKPASRAAGVLPADLRFCFQITASQQAIGKIALTDSTRLGKIADEWDRISKVAPASLSADVKAVAVAYHLAVKQPKADADTTLKTITANARRISTYASANCRAPGGNGAPGAAPSAAAQEKLQACLKKKGVVLPNLGTGQAPPNGGQGGPQLDAKAIAALQACIQEVGIKLPG